MTHSTIPASVDASLAAIFVKAHANVVMLQDRIASGQINPDVVHDVRASISALPISSADYSVAINRLNNASRYALSGQLGAADYSIRMLAKSLSNLQKFYA